MRRWPLTYVIPGLLFVLAGSLMVALMLMEVWHANQRAEQALQRQTRVLGTILAAGIETAFRQRDLGEARSIFIRANGDRDLDVAVLLDQDNHVLFSTRIVLRQRLVNQTPFADAMAMIDRARAGSFAQVIVGAQRNFVTTALPVRLTAAGTSNDPGDVGVLMLRHRLSDLRREAIEDAVVGIVAPISALVVVCFMVWLALRRLIIARVVALADAAKQLVRHQPSVPVDTSGADEIANLAQAIDEAGSQIRHYTEELEASHRFVNEALDAVPANIAVIDANGMITSVNKAWRRFADDNSLTLDRYGVGTSYLAVCEAAGGNAREVFDGINRLLHGEASDFSIEYDCHSPNEKRWFELRMSRFAVNGEVRCIMAHNNVTAVVESLLAVRQGEMRYRTLYDDNPSMFFTIGTDDRIVSANEFGARQLGYEPDDLIGVDIVSLYVGERRAQVLEHLAACRDDDNQVRRWESEKRRKDGSHLHARETGRAVTDEHGNRTVLVVCEDVTETIELSRELEFRATHDSLTGLINRFEFERRLADALESAQNDKATHVLCYLDLDQFKVINDTCGHVAGDELLRQLTRGFLNKVRRHDTLARLGGDEFALLMEHCPLERGEALAEGLRSAVEEFRFSWESRTFSIGTSIGVVVIDHQASTVSDLLSTADAACYAAKDAGRNRVHVFRPGDADFARRRGQMHWAAEIQSAIDESRFELYYQPLLPLKADDSLWHYELLVRMRDRDGELVMPGAVLPAAERYNLASRIDRCVVDAAFAWLQANPKHVAQLSVCSINLSGQSLGEEQFLEHLVGCLKSGTLEPEKICFELTETAAIANLTGAMSFMQRINELGSSFALDDFGSGLSSFAYLKHLPVRYLKIDGQFVKDMIDDPIDAAMVSSINDIGHVIGHQTTAEFVETPAVLHRLAEIGVDYAQGYGIARPAPLSTILESAPPRRNDTLLRGLKSVG